MLTVFNRWLSNVIGLARMMQTECQIEVDCHSLARIHEKFPESDIVVNCTPIGMKGHSIDQTPVPSSLLNRVDVAMDLVYNPIHTRFLDDAQTAGCLAITGETMLVYQGAASFEIWTGRCAPVEVMKAIVLSALTGKSDE
jgi:shikimate dehydrogenase